MVDRRGFLAGTGALAAMLWLPKPWGLWKPTRAPQAFAPRATNYLSIICVGGCNTGPEPSELGGVRIMRPDGTLLLDMPVNTYGGICRWVADDPIYGPVRFALIGNVSVTAMGRQNGEWIGMTRRLGDLTPPVLRLSPVQSAHG